MGRSCRKNGILNIGKEIRCPESGGKEGEEDRECDGRTALRDGWKEWEENGAQHQKIQGVGGR